MMSFLLFVLTTLSFIFIYNPYINPPNFGEQVNLGEIENDDIVEASGIVASTKNSGVLWAHNDSGNENRIFAIDTAGNSLGTYYLKGITNRDWEDIAIGSGPDETKTYLYIGDNNSNNDIKYIYRILEPTISVGQTNIVDTIQQVSVISFSYPDDNRDAEILMFDPITKSIYVIGKRDSKIRVYKLSFPQSTSSNTEAELVTNITLERDPEEDTPNNYLTAGDISTDGKEIVIKSYNSVFYWAREDGVSIEQALETIPSMLPYNTEPQGEALCWNPIADKGYYTLSEEIIFLNGFEFVFPAQLYYYPRELTVGNLDENPQIISFSLEQNYPNPFNPITTIKYSVPNVETHSHASQQLVVYDILGKEVVTLVNKIQKPGNYQVSFNSKELSNGIYYYQLKVDNFIQTKKMVLLK